MTRTTMLPTGRPLTQMPRAMRRTWRSLDPNGDTSSNGSSQLQPLLQILAQADRLRPERRLDEAFLGFRRMREQRRIHRDGGREQGEEEHGQPGGLRQPPHPAVDARERQRAGAGDENRDPERA